MAKYQTVNEKGLAEISRILSERHKLGGDHFGPAEIAAWAEDVEFQLGEGNGPSFEIKSADTVSGHTEEFTLDDDCLSWVSYE